MINRREFLGITAGAGASLALAPELLHALRALQQPAGLIQRAIPSTGEKLPALGLSFSNHAACADHAALKEVLNTFFKQGGRVYDALHVSADSEQFHISAASELGIQNTLFWTTRGSPPNVAPQPGAAFVTGHIDSLLAKIKTPKIDLVMLPVAADATNLAALKAEKQAGRVRYIGVQTISASLQIAKLESIMRSEPIDFIGVDYDVINRRVEDTILPLALERKIGVMAFFPFGNASGLSCTGGTSLFSRTAGRPLPEWAAEFDAKSWAQFFLKYVVSHPAVTVARVSTRSATHMVDNIGGGVGRLPNEATRKRMAALIDSLPVAAAQPAQQAQGPDERAPLVLSAALLDRYAGNYKTATGEIVTVRRYGTMLVAKPGNNADTVIYPLSETRFSLGPNFIDFQLDSAGTVSGLVFEGGGQKIPASRTR